MHVEKKRCLDPSESTLPALSAFQKKRTKKENVFEEAPLAPFCGTTAQLCTRQPSAAAAVVLPAKEGSGSAISGSDPGGLDQERR